MIQQKGFFKFSWQRNFEIERKLAKTIINQGEPLVSMTLVANGKNDSTKGFFQILLRNCWQAVYDYILIFKLNVQFKVTGRQSDFVVTANRWCH